MHTKEYYAALRRTMPAPMKPHTNSAAVAEAEHQKQVLGAVGDLTVATRRRDAEFRNALAPLIERGEHARFISSLNGIAPHLVPAAPSNSRAAAITNIQTMLNEDPAAREWLSAKLKHLTDCSPQFFTDGESRIARTFNTGSDPGAGTVPTNVTPIFFNNMPQYAAWATLGVVPLDTGKTRLAQISVEPYAAWITPANAGNSALIPGSITGGSMDTDCPTIACLIEVSRPVLEDGKLTILAVFIEAVLTSLNKHADCACYSADGTDDATDGGQTGIFAHASVPVVTASGGRTTAASLVFQDFADCLAAVSASALQRPCRWWIHPSFLSKLITIKDGNEKVLRQPVVAGEDWLLAGFPVTWTAAAPGTDGAGQKIAAFGRGDAFTFAIAQHLDLRRSENGRGFTSNLSLIRATMRAQAKMRDPESFAILKTAAS